MLLNIENFLDNWDIEIKEISESRDYWLVRTNSGEFYEEFSHGNYISIGWNEFLNPSDFINEKASEQMKNRIEEYYPDKQAGRIYSQIRKFIFDIKVGDVVMIPSKDSEFVNFGIVTSELFQHRINGNEDTFVKSKSIEWIKEVERDQLDPYLFKMMQAHQTVNNAEKYARYIDRTMYSLYSKGENSYLILPVKEESNIPAYDLTKFLNSLIETVMSINSITEEASMIYDLRDLDIKLNIQSPGFVELMSSANELIKKVVVFLKSALSGNSDLTNELLEKTSPEKIRDLQRKQEKVIEAFERVKADLPEDIYRKPPLD
ncbi:hypothetical protein [Lysinibacillus fusiformis]|uniref:hypothetical protein n=1 Tax=Lysinibacillus fusiformis TaxID=28031 RepID=UPI003CF69277